MSESQKTAVLAKCEELTKETKYASDNDDDWDLEREDGGFILEAWGGCIKLNFCKLDDADHEVWQLAADILKITPSIDEFEADLSRRQYHHDLEQARKEGYEAGKAATLWPAYLAAATRFVGVAGINILNIEELAKAEFDKWVATLPPDTLKADRDWLAANFTSGTLEKELQRLCYNPEFIGCLKRLAGMEVGNG